MGVIKSKYNNASHGSGGKMIISVDTAVDRIGVGNFQRKVLLATGTCFMADSVQVMLFSILTRKLQREWLFSDTIASMITSCLFAGATIGTLILGPLGDRIGRKPVLVAAAIIISIFGFCTALCPNYMTLFPIIFFIGFG
jgi:MFS family permease